MIIHSTWMTIPRILSTTVRRISFDWRGDGYECKVFWLKEFPWLPPYKYGYTPVLDRLYHKHRETAGERVRDRIESRYMKKMSNWQ